MGRNFDGLNREGDRLTAVEAGHIGRVAFAFWIAASPKKCLRKLMPPATFLRMLMVAMGTVPDRRIGHSFVTMGTEQSEWE